MKTVAASQSNYIPWKGYFDIINDSDEFIICDEVQYTRCDWRNRNILYFHGQKKWITLPCGNNLKRTIDEVRFSESIPWQQKHWEMIKLAYKKAPFYNIYSPFFEDVYLGKKWEYLSQLNVYLIKHIANVFLKIPAIITDSRSYQTHGTASERALSLLKSAKADRFVSGPAAKNYIKQNEFEEAGIEIIWKDYSGYPEYKQLHTPFIHEVSILDVLFNTGADAPYYVWDWRKKNNS
ncbi:MAG: WbqC family protein [Defluviitaleaceae bacterium]|nr:WbqC family protein [Defluviitaleaceae bacterium]